RCDGADNDCDGEIDEGVLTPFWPDSDNDGYGSPTGRTEACEAPSGYVDNNTDCDDTSRAANPGEVEVCDEVDNNCDGSVDEGVTITLFADTDEDGLGNPDTASEGCTASTLQVTNGDDCDDTTEIIGLCCSAGGDGDLIISSDTELASGTYRFDRFVIQAEATVFVTGVSPLIINANEIFIAGRLDLSGEPGFSSGAGNAPGGGDAGAGGGGGGGGGDCGNSPGGGGEPNGVAALVRDGDSDGFEVEGDGGAGGVAWGVNAAPATGGDFGLGGGGGGGGAAKDGGAGTQSDNINGLGGGGFGANDLDLLLTGGGGGAGGGANGGGGGGGGGAVKLSANRITVSGRIDVSGGDGGGKFDGDCTSGGGGGGGGGMAYLSGDIVTFTGAIDARGGNGGTIDETVNLNQPGGAGSPGRIEISGQQVDLSGEVFDAGSLETETRPFTCEPTITEIADIQEERVDFNKLSWVDGVVTAVGRNGIWIQDPEGGEYSGLFIYTDDILYSLMVGDRVRVQGRVIDFNGLTELDLRELPGQIFFESAVSPLTPEPLDINVLLDPARAEPWEGVLVSVSDVAVTELRAFSGECVIDDGLVVSNLAYSYLNDFPIEVDNKFSQITGPVHYLFEEFRIVPRGSEDLIRSE
ncbi:MAG: MopE-related protein, partial [Myxococcota bacterium]